MIGGGSGSEGAGPGARVLSILLLAYIFNFIDRQIIGVLAVPIRRSSGSPTRRWADLGIVFGIFYATIAIPIAWLADRRSRVNIIAASVAVWSLFTAACGLAQSYCAAGPRPDGRRRSARRAGSRPPTR